MSGQELPESVELPLRNKAGVLLGVAAIDPADLALVGCYKWHMHVRRNGKAAIAYDELAVMYHGEFARLNFPELAARHKQQQPPQPKPLLLPLL